MFIMCLSCVYQRLSYVIIVHHILSFILRSLYSMVCHHVPWHCVMFQWVSVGQGERISPAWATVHQHGFTERCFLTNLVAGAGCTGGFVGEHGTHSGQSSNEKERDILDCCFGRTCRREWARLFLAHCFSANETGPHIARAVIWAFGCIWSWDWTMIRTRGSNGWHRSLNVPHA